MILIILKKHIKIEGLLLVATPFYCMILYNIVNQI